MNIMRAHRQREEAKKSAEIAANARALAAENAIVLNDGDGDEDGEIPSPSGNSASDLMLIKLIEDRRRLKDLQSTTAKVALKRDELLPEYQAWIDGLLSVAGDWPVGQANDVLTTIMMWSIDAGDIARALDIAEMVLAQDIPLPSQFNRTPGCAIAEEIAEAAFAAIRDKTDFDADLIARTQLVTEGQDMPDQVRAKLFKAEALLANRALVDLDATGEQPDGPAGAAQSLTNAALAAANEALRLDGTSGVKTLILTLEKRLKKFVPAPTSETTPNSEAASAPPQA